MVPTACGRNWPLLYYQVNRDHARPDLIWNHKTREELRESLESELRGFNIDKVRRRQSDGGRPENPLRQRTRKAGRLCNRALGVGQDLGGSRDVAWNYVEYEVRYESLADELKIGDHYVRLLLEQGMPADRIAARPAQWPENSGG